jgi:hypothetical protein
MLRCFLILAVTSCWLQPLFAHDIITTNLTYTRDISRIFARRCVGCHAQGTSIPLTSYEEVRPWAVDIKEQVLSRAMPPWGAVKGFGNLSPDLGLSQEELLIVAAWVIGGAPQGDAGLLPRTMQSVSLPHAPPLSDALTVSTKSTIKQQITVTGIKPLPTSMVDSSRITAQLPDGRIQPLLWLYRYDPKWKRTFAFREPVTLPAGTVIQSSSPLQFALEKQTQSAFTGTVKDTVFTTP